MVLFKKFRKCIVSRFEIQLQVADHLIFPLRLFFPSLPFLFNIFHSDEFQRSIRESFPLLLPLRLGTICFSHNFFALLWYKVAKVYKQLFSMLEALLMWINFKAVILTFPSDISRFILSGNEMICLSVMKRKTKWE